MKVKKRNLKHSLQNGVGNITRCSNSVTTDHTAQKWACDIKAPPSLGLSATNDKEIGILLRNTIKHKIK